MLRALALISRRSRFFERTAIDFGTVRLAVFFLETGLFLLACFRELACLCDAGRFSGFPARREPGIDFLRFHARIYSPAEQKSSAGRCAGPGAVLSFRRRRGYI